MTHYETLGVAKDATDDEIKKAYKKLASKHHPDKGGDTAKFQEIQGAYDIIGDATKRAQYDNPPSHGDGFQQYSDINDILAQMRAQARMHQVFEFMTQLPIEAAFKGHTIDVSFNGVKDQIVLPAGIPNGARGQFKSEGGKTCVVTVQFSPSAFETREISEARPIIGANGQATGEIDTGDLTTTVDVEALDILLGAWIHVTDFLGDKYQVRVPAGHNVQQRLKLKGKGYKNWSIQKDKAVDHRADLYVRVNPIFKQPKDLDYTKVQALHDVCRPKPIDIKA